MATEKKEKKKKWAEEELIELFDSTDKEGSLRIVAVLRHFKVILERDLL